MNSDRLPLVIRIFVVALVIRRTKRGVFLVCVRAEMDAEKERGREKKEKARKGSIEAFTLPSKERMEGRKRDREETVGKEQREEVMNKENRGRRREEPREREMGEA